MKYIVIEIQKNQNGAIGNFVWAYDDIQAAESKYHAVLSAAAVSSFPVHSACILNETCFPVEHRSFFHAEPEPEVEE